MGNSSIKPTVLIVDDSRAARRYVSDLLSQAGYLVVTANDGNRYLSAVSAADPDVVLLDVEMPGKSGLEVLREEGLKPRLFSIILFTTRCALGQVAAGLELGADDYIVKPFQEIDLLARIGAAVRNVRHKRALARAREEMASALEQLRGTQRKLVEQEKVGAVATLAAAAAHHINNPLGFMMSNLSTLDRYLRALLSFSDRLAGELRATSPEAEHAVAELERTHRTGPIRRDLGYLLEETREGGQRIALIIQQLAQLELGLASEGSRELDLVSLLHPLIGMAGTLAPPGTEIHWQRPQREIRVQGSLTLLNASLMALLKNACEAVEGAAATISVAVTAAAGVAAITIANSGPPIPEADLPSLFAPFFSTKPPASHVGLGLTIAQHFISGHGGRISLASDAAGTCVTVQLHLAAGDDRSR